MRVDQRAVTRKQRGVERAGDDRDVKRLVGDTGAVAGAVRGCKQDEGDGAGGKSCQNDGSSAVGPYVAGTGTSSRRRYTPSCAR